MQEKIKVASEARPDRSEAVQPKRDISQRHLCSSEGINMPKSKQEPCLLRELIRQQFLSNALLSFELHNPKY